MKKFFIILFLSILFLFYGYSRNVAKTTRLAPPVKRISILPTVPTPAPDNRIKVVKDFLISYGSPMVDSAEDFVRAADENNLDYRLLPAIAGVESTFGKFTPECAYFNAFGWTSSVSPCGFYRFESYREAIFIVAEGIGRGQTYSRFQETKRISDFAKIYNPVSSSKWNDNVIFFIGKLK